MLDSGNCYKPRLMMAKLGRPFKHVEVSSHVGGSRADAFTARNPNAMVPLFEFDDGRLLAGLEGGEYLAGVRHAGAEGARYIASIQGRPAAGKQGGQPFHVRGGPVVGGGEYPHWLNRNVAVQPNVEGQLTPSRQVEVLSLVVLLQAGAKPAARRIHSRTIWIGHFHPQAVLAPPGNVKDASVPHPEARVLGDVDKVYPDVSAR